jgi:hypothetical protein
MKNIVNYSKFVNEEFNLMDPFGRKKKRQLEEDERKQIRDEYEKSQKRYREYEKYIEDLFSDKAKKCGYKLYIFDPYDENYVDDVDFSEIPLELMLYGDKYNIHITERPEKKYYFLYIEDREKNKVVNKKSDNIDKIFDYICKNYHGDYEDIWL